MNGTSKAHFLRETNGKNHYLGVYTSVPKNFFLRFP